MLRESADNGKPGNAILKSGGRDGCRGSNSISCNNCTIKGLCLAKVLHGSQVKALDELVQHPKPARKGSHIFRQGTTFKSVYVVRSGAVKTYRIDNSGEEQITGFYLPGELFGIDGLSNNKFVNSAVALDTTAICEIPFTALESLFENNGELRRHFMSLLSSEIIKEQQIMMLLSQKRAEERLAHFLLDLSQRYQQRRLSAEAFMLPMSRKDIGNYLGLAVETLSRLVTRFQQMGWITANNRSITITDKAALEELVDCPKAAA